MPHLNDLHEGTKRPTSNTLQTASSEFEPPAPVPSELGFETLAVRFGQRRTAEGEHNDPLFLTSSFVFKSAEEAAARFSETEPGNVYSRFTNPTVQAFEARLAALEQGQFCVATASGMAAILSTCLALLKSGDEVVAAKSLFGSTLTLFSNLLSRYGIEAKFVETADLACWSAACSSRTRLLFLETPTNPLGEIADIAALARVAAQHDALLAVDNCFLTPVLQRPLESGADIVIHSATKYLDGQGRCVGGAIVTRDKDVHDRIFATIRTGGACMSPFNAWVFLNGLETLSLRVRAHSEAALEVARWLGAQEGIAHVYYTGLPSHPQHALACRQQAGFGGTVAFDIEGGRDEAFAFINAVQLFSITANLGDAKSTITHPASTTHGRLTDEQRTEAGIGEGLIRTSIGLETVADIKADLSRAIAAMRQRGHASSDAAPSLDAMRLGR